METSSVEQSVLSTVTPVGPFRRDWKCDRRCPFHSGSPDSKGSEGLPNGAGRCEYLSPETTRSLPVPVPSSPVSATNPLSVGDVGVREIRAEVWVGGWVGRPRRTVSVEPRDRGVGCVLRGTGRNGEGVVG